MFIGIILEALFLGAVSSLHCAGMCGPFMFALPLRSVSPVRRGALVSLYHGGRIFTYGLLGLVFGIAGRRIQLAGWQQWFSIGLGISILLGVLLKFACRRNFQPSFMQKYFSLISRLLTSLWTRPGGTPYFVLGMVNGLLPCGMVYIAVAASIASGSAVSGIAYMLSFGIGTLPMLIGIVSFRFLLRPSVRTGMKNIVPLMTACLGLLLLLRGLDLGIPFISPVLATTPAKIISCH
jgi:sulfite exporter TauE/SafE